MKNGILFGKCCMPQEEKNSSLNSFLSSNRHSQCSRVSKEAYFDSRDIDVMFIKPYQCETWNQWSEDDAYSYSCTSSRKGSGRKLENKSNKKSIFYAGVLSEEETDRASRASSASNSMYVAASSTAKLSNNNKFLDWISSCFWKCSAGCQQIPSINID